MSNSKMSNSENLAVNSPILTGVQCPQKVTETLCSRRVFIHISCEGKLNSGQLHFKLSFKKTIFQIMSKNNFQNFSSHIRAFQDYNLLYSSTVASAVLSQIQYTEICGLTFLMKIIMNGLSVQLVSVTATPPFELEESRADIVFKSCFSSVQRHRSYNP